MGPALGLCLGLLLAGGCGSGGDPAGAAGSSAGEGPRVRLKVQGGYPFNMPILGEGIVHLRETYEALPETGARLRIYDSGKLVPTLGIFDAVAAGRIDAGIAFPAYWIGKVPAAAVFGALPYGPDATVVLGWLQEGGGLALWREIYAAYGVVPVPCGVLPPEAAGWFRTPIESPEDLRGLKVRYAGLGGKVLEKLGASATQIPAGDIFVSLERGVLDATEYSMPVVDRNLGFHKVADHYYFPGWHQPSSVVELLVNAETWAGLSDGQRAAIEVACGETTRWMLARGVSVQAEALAFFESEGVTVHEWPPSVDAALRAATKELLAEMSAEDEPFARALASLRGFIERQRPWSAIAYPAEAPAE